MEVKLLRSEVSPCGEVFSANSTYTAADMDTAHPSDMEAYYSAEEQQRYGVVGIALFPPN